MKYDTYTVACVEDLQRRAVALAHRLGCAEILDKETLSVPYTHQYLLVIPLLEQIVKKIEAA